MPLLAARALFQGLLIAVLLAFAQCRPLPPHLPWTAVRQATVSPPAAVAIPPGGPPSPAPGAGTPAASPVPAASVQPSPDTANRTAQPDGMAPVAPGANGTIWGLVQSGAGDFDTNGGDYDMFSRAVNITNYAGVLTDNNGGKGVTLFAPTDAAFLRTARDLGYQSDDEEGAFNAILRVLGNLTRGKPGDALVSIVGYHILPAGYNAQLLRERTPVETYQGSQIVINGFTLRHVATRLPDPRLVGGNIDRGASNGLLHGIDRILFPFDIDPTLTRAIVNAAAPLSNNQPPENQSGRTVCFPASATVLRADGTETRMREVEPGDELRVSGRAARTSKVYLFTHRQFHGWYEFVRITTRDEEHVVTLSAAHYLYANGALKRADEVCVGDVVRTVSGPRRVAEVSTVWEQGLLAPHTLHGDIVVGGVVASTYTAIFPPQVAHALLAPVRAVVHSGIAREPLGNTFYNGKPRLEIGNAAARLAQQAVWLLLLQMRSG